MTKTDAETAEASTEPTPYVPSARGMRVARLIDGEARTWWDEVHPDVTAADHRNAAALLDQIVDAYEVADRSVLDRLPEVIAILGGRDTFGKRLAMYVAYLEHALLRSRSEGLGYERRQHWYLVRQGLIEHYDSAFAKLSPERLEAALGSVTRDPNVKGGRHHKELPLIAGELIIEAGAFSFKNHTASQVAARLRTEVDRTNPAKRRPLAEVEGEQAPPSGNAP